MEYQYLKLIVAVLHVIIIALCIYKIFTYSKAIIIDKAPTRGSFLSIFNIKEIVEMLFFTLIMSYNIYILVNFYERISVYHYKIFFMMSTIGLIYITISNKRRLE